MADFRKKRRLRNYLLNARLQLYYVAWVIVLATSVAAVLGTVVYRQSTFASSQLAETLSSPEMEWLDPVLRQQIMERLTQTDTGLAISMLGIGLVLALVLFAALVVMTHKVAGPIYRVTLLFEQLRSGRFAPIGDLRKGDQFGDLFEALRAALAATRQRAADDLVAIEDILAASAAPGAEPTEELIALLAELKAVQQEKQLGVGASGS